MHPYEWSQKTSPHIYLKKLTKGYMPPKHGSQSRWKEKLTTWKIRDPVQNRGKGAPQNNDEWGTEIAVGPGHRG